MEDIFRKAFLPVSKISPKTNSILEICLKSLIKNLTKSLKLKEDILINSDFFDKIISEFSNRFEETQSNEQLFKTFLSSVVISNDNNKMLSELENTKMATIHKKYFESCNRAIINFIESGTLETAMSLLLLVTRATPSVGIKIANQKQILQAAVDISHDKSNKIWLSAAEILALGCSNKQIRLTIVDAELYQMFAELLLQNFAEKTVYADKDNIAKAKTTSVALLALSKLTAMSQKVKDFVLNFRLSGNGENANIEPLAIVSAFSVLEKLKNSEEQIVSDIVEAISFLSVHIEIKQIICNNL
ncbi:hypothetical protein MHBO_001363 [Bonamia ostreae]|uniref:Uncharacterized protein n=1 Tax=Bonamia ostreae TaxID=126728 RepID=A0ABV2AJK8_9EUKA